MAEQRSSGGGAATLIAILLVLFSLYMIFLPPEETQRLLDLDHQDNGNGAPSVSVRALALVNETAIGHLEYTQEENISHDIPNLNLFETAKSVTLVSFSPFDVTRGWFSSRPKQHTFLLRDLNNVDRVMLTFQARKHDGTLRVLLNGVEVFSGSTATIVAPIELPLSLLRAENTLEFSVEGGVFQRKHYALSDVKITADVRDPSRTAARFDFGINDEEYKLFESGRLEFFALCDDRSVGKLSIRLNGRQIYDALPNCDTRTFHDLFKDDFAQGRNTLEFSLSGGAIQLETAKVELMLKPSKPYISYFFVNESLFQDFGDHDRWANLTLKFVDDIEFGHQRERKRADLLVNGVLFSIDQRDPTYQRDVTPHVREGNNYIRIMPRTDLDIVELSLTAQQR